MMKKILWLIIFSLGIYCTFEIVDRYILDKNDELKTSSMPKKINEGNKENTVQLQGETKGYVVIVIDDFGNNRNGTEEMMNMPAKLVFAVMPFMPNSKEEAMIGHGKGYEIIIHFPMEPHRGKLSWLGENPILDKLSNEEITDIFNKALEEMPHTIGFNNHMGSKVTENQRIIGHMLDLAKQHNLIVIDSKTTQNSVIEEIGKEKEVPVFERTIFLDNEKNLSAIKKQLSKLIDASIEKGYAIGIGHVGQEGGKITAQAIKEMLPVFEEKGIDIIGLKDLVQKTKSVKHFVEK